jgi:predicted Zn-dependent peptidase
MIKKVLKNGLTIILEHKKCNSVVIEVTARVGSNNESEKILGISHFIEHTIFSGTNKRSPKDVARSIESIGGEMNAMTTNERTSFYVRVPSKYFDIALDVLSDCIINSQFKEEEIEKERHIILSELDIFKDTPTIYQWILFQGKLFKKIPAKNNIGGTKETVSKITREDIIKFYQQHYVKKNMIITVVGNFDKNVANKIEFKFSDIKNDEPQPIIEILEPKQEKKEEYIERRKIDHSYFVIGYKVPGRNNLDSYVLDLIRIIMGTGQNSRLYEEIRLKRGLGYAVGSHYESNKDYGFFASFITAEKKNMNECKSIIIDGYKKIADVKDQELNDAKRFTEGQFLLENEDNLKRTDLISSFEVLSDAKILDSYIKNINKVTKEDIKKVASKYFDGNYCSMMITK